MKPARLQVFDGLRITTEHIDFFQDSLHVALADIHEILGLGMVQIGFDVQPQGDQAVVVGPGLAFDYQRHRIVLDEPQTVPVAFPPGQDRLYLCAQHGRVETDQVEGHATQLWDSGSLSLRATPPMPPENLVPIARLERLSGSGGAAFQVTRLPEPLPAPAELPVSPPAMPGIRARQDVTRLSGSVSGGATLLQALRDRLDSPAAPGGAEIAVPLAVADITPGFAAVSLSCHTILRTRVSAPTAPAAGEGVPAEMPAWYQATAHGEVTFAPESVRQFGLSVLQSSPIAGQTSPASDHWPEFTEQGVAYLPFGLVGSDRLALRAEIVVGDGAGFRIVCTLLWKGDVTAEAMLTLDTQMPAFSWGMILAWKALG